MKNFDAQKYTKILRFFYTFAKRGLIIAKKCDSWAECATEDNHLATTKTNCTR